LSVPQPKVPIRWRVLEWFLRVFLGVSLLVLGVVLVLELITEILRTPSGQAGVFLFGSLLAVLAWMWAKLPEWLRKFIRKQFSKRRNRREDE
jgi:membrane protease YdiL (CAAX protease family)